MSNQISLFIDLTAMPKISVVLNTYNSARFLRETISSVQRQTFSDFELLLIDDGSQDNTLAIVSSIKDSRIKFYSYPNGGIAKSRNRGLQHTTTKFIAFLDHDDLWHEQKLEHQYQLLSENSDACFVYSWVTTITESGETIRSYPKIRYAENAYKEILTKNFLHTTSNPLLRRKHVINIGGFDEEIYGADDWDLFIRLAAQYPILVSPYHDVYYRIVKGSGSANVDKIEQGCLRVVNKAFHDSPPELSPIKPKSLGIVYQFLCFRTLEEAANKTSGFKALKYFAKSYRYYSALWSFAPAIKVFVKAALTIMLPRHVFQYCLKQIKFCLAKR